MMRPYGSNPIMPHAYNSRGYAKKMLGQHEAAEADYKTAIDHFNAVIRLNPNSVLAYYNRGLAKRHLGQYEAAIADYDASHTAQTRLCPMPMPIEAYAKRRLGQYEAAIADYDQAIRLKPDYAKPIQSMLCHQLGHYN